MYVYNLYQEYLSRLDSERSQHYDDYDNYDDYAGNVGTTKRIHEFYPEKQNIDNRYTYRVKKAGKKRLTKRKRLRKNYHKTKKTKGRK